MNYNLLFILAIVYNIWCLEGQTTQVPATTTTTTTTTTTAKPLDECDPRVLAGTGLTVSVPQTTEYENLRYHDFFAAFKGTLEEREELYTPGAIIVPSTKDDLVSIVNFARKCDYTITVKSGGHQYSGLSGCNDEGCLLVRMDNFNQMKFTPGSTTVVVEAGVKLGDLYATMATKGMSIFGGNCAGVAAGGHYQSTSQGAAAASLGLGMDFIDEFTIVLASGKIKTCKRGDKDRLYWAVLGSAPGSWGILVDYTFTAVLDSLYPNSFIYVKFWFYHPDVFKAVFSQFMQTLANPYYMNYQDLTIYMGATPRLANPDDANTRVAYLVYVYYFWTGASNGNVHTPLPGQSNPNVTFYSTIFDPLNNIAVPFQVPGTTVDMHLPLSILIDQTKASEPGITVPPYRYYNQHSTFKRGQMNRLLRNTDNLKEWIDKISAKVFEVSATGGVEVFFQIWSFIKKNALHNGHKFYNNPLKNVNSFPLRNVGFETDCWVLFGSNEEYNETTAAEAELYRDELDDIIENDVASSKIRCTAYTDDKPENIDLYSKWRNWYSFGARQSAKYYYTLRWIKRMIDPQNIFDGPMNIKPAGWRKCHQRERGKKLYVAKKGEYHNTWWHHLWEYVNKWDIWFPARSEQQNQLQLEQESNAKHEHELESNARKESANILTPTEIDDIIRHYRQTHPEPRPQEYQPQAQPKSIGIEPKPKPDNNNNLNLFISIEIVLVILVLVMLGCLGILMCGKSPESNNKANENKYGQIPIDASEMSSTTVANAI